MIYRPPQNQPEERPPTPEEVVEQGESVDVLYDFFDFVDATVEDLQAYVLYRFDSPELSRDIVAKVYEIVLRRWRVFRAKKRATLSMLLALADREMASLPKTVSVKDVPPRDQLEEMLKSRRKSMTAEEKIRLRMGLLERYKKRRRVAMMMLLQTAVLLIAVPSASLFFVRPQPMGSTFQQLAAVEVLLVEQERSYLTALMGAESHLQALAAHYGEEEIAAMSVELASHALVDQARDKQSANGILKQFGARTVAFLTRPLLALSP